jgi:excinuclease UvrABC nuclease subunit
MKRVLDTIIKLKNFFHIECEVQTKLFSEHKTILNHNRGVYVLVDQEDRVIYVGKGNIKDRQIRHWNKSHGIIKSGTIDPKGWKWIRENYEITPNNWKLFYIELKKETELSAMEGGLIHMLQPLANDETFKDEKRILKSS